MGQGKTTWAIEHMRSNPEDNYIYIAPLLSEDERIRDAIVRDENREMICPKNKGSGKLGDLDFHLRQGHNIASTHHLFKELTTDMYDSILCNKYTLILDETLDVLEKVNVKSGTLLAMQRFGLITTDEFGLVTWHEKLENEISDFDGYKELALKHQLILIKDKFFIWQYPPEIFNLFDKVYVLTYMFESSILYNYMKLHKMNYQKKSICLYEDGHRELCDFSEPDVAKLFKDKIHIYEGKMNSNIKQGKTTFSKSWLVPKKRKDCNGNAVVVSQRKGSKEDVSQLRKNLHNYFGTWLSAREDEIMWSTSKEAAESLDGRGFKYVDTEKFPNEVNDTFVACNARGTNEFSDKRCLAYVLNVFLQPEICQYFAELSNNEIIVDEDAYALSQLIQWIWRSAIRKGQDIWIYIPSDRMRNLLKRWLGYKRGEACQRVDYRRV